MIVVADTSPINYLVLVDAIDVLSGLYQKVIIPKAVLDELHADEAPEKVRAWLVKMPDWISTEQPSVLIDTDLEKLDLGERDAIALAEDLNADALIIDDRAGRDEAKKRGIFVIGTLGVLNSAAEKGLLSLPDTLSKLQQTSFRASEKLISAMLQIDKERSIGKAK